MTENYASMARALEDREDEIARLTIQLEAFKAAARKFIGKVDAGKARSTETYNDLKAALEMRNEN